MSKVLLFENTADVQMSLAEEYLRDGNLPDAIKAIRTAWIWEKPIFNPDWWDLRLNLFVRRTQEGWTVLNVYLD